jgi:conjugative transposon TraM protein
METKNSTIISSRHKKLLLVVPLLVLPFFTMLFWAAGGGRGGEGTIINENKGFNLNLPNAKNDEDAKLSKFNYYESAALDSAKIEELRKKDPNYISGTLQGDSITGKVPDKSDQGLRRGLNMANHDPTEEKLYQRLEQLKKAVREPAYRPEAIKAGSASGVAQVTTSPDVSRLEQMMQSMQQSPEPEDKEMQQINGMLENILDIQHPERQQEKLRKASEAARGQVFPVQLDNAEQPVSILNQSQEGGVANFGGTAIHNRFYSLDESYTQPVAQNAVQASIAETQTIVNGSTIKMKLEQDIFINGVKIPTNTFVYGSASLKGERLSVAVAAIRYGNSIYPVNLSVFDLDGLDGMYIPGAISRDVAKASADQSMQTLGVATLDDSWSAQATGAGIEAAKSFLSKKVKLVKVIVKAGYQVLLRDGKQKDKP